MQYWFWPIDWFFINFDQFLTPPPVLWSISHFNAAYLTTQFFFQFFYFLKGQIIHQKIDFLGLIWIKNRSIELIYRIFDIDTSVIETFFEMMKYFLRKIKIKFSALVEYFLSVKSTLAPLSKTRISTQNYFTW